MYGSNPPFLVVKVRCPICRLVMPFANSLPRPSRFPPSSISELPTSQSSLLDTCFLVTLALGRYAHSAQWNVASPFRPAAPRDATRGMLGANTRTTPPPRLYDPVGACL